jgi:hypothetical protein
MAPQECPDSDIRLDFISEVFARILQLEDLEGGINRPRHEGGNDDVARQVAKMLERPAGALHPTAEFEGAGLEDYHEASWPPRKEGQAGPHQEPGHRTVSGVEQPQNIRSLKKVKSHPDWEGPGGFKQAAQNEFSRVMIKFRSYERAPFSEVAAVHMQG